MEQSQQQNALPCEARKPSEAKVPNKARRLRIAIDGPAGAGKSTVAREVARISDTHTSIQERCTVRWPFWLWTAKYLSMTFRLWGIWHRQFKLMHVKITEFSGYGSMGRVQVGSGILRPISLWLLAMAKPVRQVLISVQRELARRGGVVMEGRDITSVVMPDAEVKVYLTAGRKERATRRWRELTNKGVAIAFDEVLSEMKQEMQGSGKGLGKTSQG